MTNYFEVPRDDIGLTFRAFPSPACDDLGLDADGTVWFASSEPLTKDEWVCVHRSAGEASIADAAVIIDAILARDHPTFIAAMTSYLGSRLESYARRAPEMIPMVGLIQELEVDRLRVDDRLRETLLGLSAVQRRFLRDAATDALLADQGLRRR